MLHRLSPFVLLLVFIFFSPTGCERTPDNPQPISVKVKQLAPEKVRSAMRFSATVKPRQTIELAFKVSGTVERLYRVKTTTGERDVQEGDHVPKGAVLAQLELRDYEREVERATADLNRAIANIGKTEANLKNAERELERAQNLVKGSAAAQKELDSAIAARDMALAELNVAKSERAAAEVALRQAEDRLKDCKLLVPIDNATVVMKAVEPGERIAAGAKVVFRIMDISTVHVEFGVPEVMLGDPATGQIEARVSLGQEIDVLADAFEGRRFKGRITKIAPAADPTTRTFLTEVTLDNPQGLIKPGMLATVYVGQEKEAVLVPITAIQRGPKPGELVVYKIETKSGISTAHRKRVETSGVYNNQIEIKMASSEVRLGDQIAITGAWRLDEGAPVRVVEEKPEQILP